MRVALFFCILHFAFCIQAAAQPVLRWGGDAEGGAPFVEADPSDPSRVRGFDVEVAEEMAKGLGRRAQFVQVAFASIDQSAARGDFDIGMSGVEDTPARRAMLAATIPYYEFHEPGWTAAGLGRAARVGLLACKFVSPDKRQDSVVVLNNASRSQEVRVVGVKPSRSYSAVAWNRDGTGSLASLPRVRSDAYRD